MGIGGVGMNIVPRNVSVPEGWPTRSGAGEYTFDLDPSQRFERTRHSASTGRNWPVWYNVTTGFTSGYRRGTDGPLMPNGPFPAPRVMSGLHPFLPMLDAQVYALMLGRRISGPWLGDVRAGGVPWEFSVDGTRPLGRKRA